MSNPNLLVQSDSNLPNILGITAAFPRILAILCYFSRHIELYLYNAKLNQTSRKPQNSPLVTVTSSFHGQ